MKTCSRCKIKPARSAGQAWCKDCHSKWETEHRTYEQDRDRYLKSKFGITGVEYDQMVEQQGNVCLICGKEETSTRLGKLRRLSVDHDHTTGKVRGLLCSECNIGIGKFKDSPDLLRKAARYLE